MNKFCLFALSIIAVLLPALALAQGDLSGYRDRNRLLLVFAPSKLDPRWQKQNALLENSTEPFRDRDLLRFDSLEKGKISGRSLRTRYGIKPGQFRVLLVGKDGHIASASPSPITLSELAGQIDRMPMRREEMRRLAR